MKFYKLFTTLLLTMILIVACGGENHEHAGDDADKEHAGDATVEHKEHAGDHAEQKEHAGDEAEKKEHGGNAAEE